VCVPTGTPKVVAWGYNGFAQVAPIASPDVSSSVFTPTIVEGLPSDIVMLAAGETHSLALDAQGNVWAWGANGCGELGVVPGDIATDTSCFWDEYLSNPPNPNPHPFQPTPVMVQGLPRPAVAIAAGEMFSVALLDNGQVMTWGYNLAGTLGDGLSTYVPHPVPQLVIVETDAGAVPLSGVTGIYAGDGHVIATTANGTWGWGSNYDGQLAMDDQGYGLNGVHGPYPVPPMILDKVPTDARGIDAGGLHTYYIENGDLWGFGSYYNAGGANGGLLTSSIVPMEILGPALLGSSTVVQTTSAGYSGYAVADDGNVWFWGDAEANPNAHSPGPGPVLVQGLTTPAVKVWAGWLTGYSLDTFGQLWAWGDNTYGELGVAPPSASGSPIVVPGITGVTLFSTSGGHNLARAYQCAPQAPLAAAVATPLPSSVLTFDNTSCLPSPALTITGSASGGTAPYTYSWTVSILNSDGTTRAGPEIISTSPTAGTDAIPANWWFPNLDQMAVQGNGVAFVFTVTVTDATGTQATALEAVNWVCGPS
jgi:hypothetical protein